MFFVRVALVVIGDVAVFIAVVAAIVVIIVAILGHAGFELLVENPISQHRSSAKIRCQNR